MRLLFLAALLTACAIGCGKGGEAAEVSVNAAAGRVVEVTGKVEATRGGATRSLAVGAEVFRDDLVATNDGSFTIELFHNQARWVVNTPQKKRVDESAAWELAKQGSPSSPSQHATSAAGRNGERTAADTASTAHTQIVESKTDKSQATSDTESDKKKGSTGGGETKTAPEATKVETPPPPRADPLPTPRGREVDLKGQLGHAPGKLDAAGSGSSAPAPPPVALFEALRPKLVACLDATTPKLAVAVTSKGGVATASVPPGVPLAVASCLSKEIATIRESFQGTLTIQLSR